MRRWWMTVAALAVVMLAGVRAPAQDVAPQPGAGAGAGGPAGNEHPESQNLSGEAEGLANPFGDPTPEPSLSATARADMAAAVDLSPLVVLLLITAAQILIGAVQYNMRLSGFYI